jgi:hypothetical protein
MSTLARYHESTANPLVTPGFVRVPLALEAAEGHTLVDLRELGLYPLPAGAEGGYSTEADIVTTTADGIDLNAMWAEFQQTLEIYNQGRNALVALFTFSVTQLIESVPVVGESMFEMASEFGVPKAVRPELAYQSLAYDFHDYDLATRFTWKFLRDADARQVEAIHQQALNADNRLVFRKVMEALFDNNNRSADINRNNYTVFALYNGDGTVPPPYKGVTFTGSHNHYMASGSPDAGGGKAVVNSDDVEDLYDNIAEHGYGQENGTTFVLMANKIDIREIRKWRAGEGNGDDGSDGTTAVANYDFIPAPNQPALIVPNSEGLLGTQPPTAWNGLPVIGSYAGILIVEESYIPPGYLLMLATGGAGNAQNPVGFREHANAPYRGLRLLPGNQQHYPLVDSFYSRGFGTGIRQRAGSAIMQITTASTYTPPAQYTNSGATA